MVVAPCGHVFRRHSAVGSSCMVQLCSSPLTAIECSTSLPLLQGASLPAGRPPAAQRSASRPVDQSVREWVHTLHWCAGLWYPPVPSPGLHQAQDLVHHTSIRSKVASDTRIQHPDRSTGYPSTSTFIFIFYIF